MMAYTYAARQNGKKYIPVITDINHISVIEKGTLCGVVIDSNYNTIEENHKQTLQQMVNKIVITDKDGNILDFVQDFDTQINGTIQKVLKKEDGKDVYAEAQNLLNGIDQTASVTATSDPCAVSGYSILIQDSVTGLYGQFYIESDTHTFSGAKSEMQLTLAFENLMDEKELEKKQEEKNQD